MEKENITKIYVTGHRNPDVDSLASAAALAELRRRQGYINIQAICPGALPEKGKYLFERFHTTPPESRNDIYIRIRHIMTNDVACIKAGIPLLEAVSLLKSSGHMCLPIVDSNNKFLGILSPINLLSHLLGIGFDSQSSLTGRTINTSIDLIAQVIKAEILTGVDTDKIQTFKTYIATMGVESFDSHIPLSEPNELAIISGDRSDIHLRALENKIRLLIVTGEKSVEPIILNAAASQNVTILKTNLDSTKVISRLKFAVPVEDFALSEARLVLHPQFRLSRHFDQILNTPGDIIPVVEDNGELVGVVLKKSISETPPHRLILVDHNEMDQSIPGAEEIPIIEVVDHHRIGMQPTISPIKFTGDIVGSTCTLVASMYKSMGESLTPDLAGILLGGIVTDTLNLKSPTTSPLDRRMLEWLEKISGVSASSLMEELSRIDSPLASSAPDIVINSDRKTYNNGKYKFSLSQVEETNLELLHQRQEELLKTMKEIQTKENLNFIGLLVTDAVRETSEMLIIGSQEIIHDLPYKAIGPNLYDLPDVLSRKKQLLPQVLFITTEHSR